MTKNDARNEALVQQIEAKENSLVRPVIQFKTNCSLALTGGSAKNLNVCKVDELMLMKVQLNAYALSAKDLGMSPASVKIGGYSIDDWMHDINGKIEVAKYNESKKTLEQMKVNLHNLLSEDRRTEMALDSMEDALKNM